MKDVTKQPKTIQEEVNTLRASIFNSIVDNETVKGYVLVIIEDNQDTKMEIPHIYSCGLDTRDLLDCLNGAIYKVFADRDAILKTEALIAKSILQ